MEVKNLKDFKKLVQACQELGVEAIEVSGIKMNLRPMPQLIRQKSAKGSVAESLTETDDLKIPTFSPLPSVQEQIKTDGLTEEELLFYSASGQLNPQDAQ